MQTKIPHAHAIEAGLADGLTQAELARRLGISRERVRKIVEDAGLEDVGLAQRRAAIARRKSEKEQRRIERLRLQATLAEAREPRSPMTPQAFITAMESLYGEHWRAPAAAALRVNASTIYRWANGLKRVPGPAEVAIELLTADKARRHYHRDYKRSLRARKEAPDGE